MHTDPEVRRYVGGHRFREYLGRPTETYGLWATILKEERRYIGCWGLRAAPGGKAAHLGYYFARAYWGRGLASEASRAFIDFAFTRLGLVKVVADVQEGNLASETHLAEVWVSERRPGRDSG